MIWLKFACCAVIILYAGSRLSHYGEVIANRSGLSKSWVGLVLLAVIASLSQLVTSICAVEFHDLPNMAVGGLMGSCMFNMLVIGLLDVLSRDSPVSNMVHRGHILSAGFGIILLGFTAVDIFFGRNLPVLDFIHRMDPITIAFIPIYLIAMRLTFRFEKNRLQQVAREVVIRLPEENKQSWTGIVSAFFIYTLFIVVASSYLPPLAEGIQLLTGCGESFVGVSFIAITTCLPELAVSVSSARRGSFDMAVASLLGSNLCYMVILAITDFCYAKEPLLRHVSGSNALAALTAIISMAIVVIGLTYRSEKKFLFMAGDAVALVLVYLLASVLLFGAH